MIKNVIFDMGNVLLLYEPAYFLDRAGVTAEDKQLLMQEVFQSIEWAQLDRGVLSDEKAAEIMCARVPERLHEKVHLLIERWERPIIPIPGMAELVRELKEKGFGVYLLSNASARQHLYWPDIPGSEYFDAALISSDVKLLKPQPEIYQYALSRFGLKNDECVFVDDSPANAEGAVYCGIPAIVFRGDSKRLRRELRQLGVDVETE